MWNIQAKVIPRVMGALGTVPRRLPEYLRIGSLSSNYGRGHENVNMT